MTSVTNGTERKRRALAGTAIILLVLCTAGCGTAVPSPPVASGTVRPSDSTDRWVVADIAQPSAVTTAPSLEPGYQCHPCHFLAENELFDVAQTSAGPIAVGIQQPPPEAIAFTTTDLRRWEPVPGFTAAPGTSALSIVALGARTVIVGQGPVGATSWAFDGDRWRAAADLDVLRGTNGGTSMTAVIAVDGRFLAGGYRDDPAAGTKSAAVWRSDDGLAWRADDDVGHFDGGSILDMAASDQTVVAVGTNGDPTYGPAAAWRWTPAGGWRRAQLQPDDGGAMTSVTFHDGRFVAVGTSAGDRGARVWTSTDGLTWSAVPDQPAFHFYDLPARMHTVLSYPGGIAAAGLRFDAGKGSSVVWTSRDGTAWESAWETSFSGGEMDGLAVSGGSLVAVGRTGYPDWNTATIWVAPTP
jgi:hypothetical protein